MCEPEEIPNQVSTAISEGFAADEKTALGLARVLIGRIYGEKVLDSAE